MLTVALLAVLAFGICGILGAALPEPAGSRAVHRGGAGLSALLLIGGIVVLGMGPGLTWTLSLPIGLPWLRAHFALDALGAFFIVLVNAVALLSFLFGESYSAHLPERRRILPALPVFVAAMNLTLLADDAFTFLVAWEAMSLASWLLVLSSHRDPAALRAAYVYLVMATIGTVALLLCFGVLAGPDGVYDFVGMRLRADSAAAGALCLALLLIGAGSKAGLVPLHAWLPLAHPAAPSHVSALMSAAMTKVAIYAIIRVLFDLMGETQWWWGAVLIALGAGTAGYGVLHALMQRDLKVLLAWSTIENLGVITLGLGLALAFKGNNLPGLAALALLASLLHAFNHGLFKALLFFGAGAILTATGQRDLERLGGLLNRMPVTGLACLIGAAAIAAIPPLNGFVAEWMLLQAILNGPLLPQWTLKFAVPVAGALIALAAAVAAATFVKAFGIAFLGRPRTPAAAIAAEVPGGMRWPMLAAAFLCLLFGVLPAIPIALAEPVIYWLVGITPWAAEQAGWVFLDPAAERGGSYSGLILLLGGAVVLVLLVALVRRPSGAMIRRAPAWDCGYPEPSTATQYTADSFAEPVRRVFGPSLMAARPAVDMPDPGELRPAGFTLRLIDPLWHYGYEGVASAVVWLTTRMDVLQHLTIRRYLTLMFGALVVLLCGVVALR